MSDNKPGSLAEDTEQEPLEHGDEIDETPGFIPMPEGNCNDRKSQKEMMRGITPENCPYFQATFTEQDEQHGVKIASLDLLDIFYDFAFGYGKQDDPVKVNWPDRLNIFAKQSDNSYNVEFFPTHFFVTQDGTLCCLREYKKTDCTGHELTEKEVRGHDVWVFLEDENPNTRVMRLGGRIYVPYQEVCKVVKARNNAWDAQPPSELREVILKNWKGKKKGKQRSTPHMEALSSDFICVHTSQEVDAFSRAQSSGKTFVGYIMNAQAGTLTYERPDLHHHIKLSLTEDERAAGLTLGYLENLVRSQDADAVLATQYILSVLAPPPHLPARPYAGGWIDFDDVLKKISWYPQTTKERHEMHARLWEFVKYGERAHINGKAHRPEI